MEHVREFIVILLMCLNRRDALCYVMGELSDVQATLAINRREIDVVKEGGDKIRTIKKTSHDYVAVTGHLERGGGVVSVTLKSGNADGDKALAWEIFGTKGNLTIEGSSGFVQMVQPKMIYVPADDVTGTPRYSLLFVLRCLTHKVIRILLHFTAASAVS